MHFTLFSMFLFFVLTTFVHSAPTAPLDSATLLNNAQQAQQLNAQFRSANGTAAGSCNNGDTTCVQDAIASCVNGQFDASKGRCPATQRCFALPSVNSNGTTMACTSEKSAQSLINAAGASGDVTGFGSGGSTSSINSASVSFSLSGATSAPTSAPTSASTSASTASETAASNVDYYSMATNTIFAPTPAAAVASNQPTTTVTVTLIATALPSMITTTLPSVTETLSPEQASSLLASLLAQGAQTAPTTNSPSETISSTVSATAVVTPTVTPDLTSYPSSGSSASLSSIVFASAANIPSSASPSLNTPVAIAHNTNSPTNPGSGGYSGY